MWLAQGLTAAAVTCTGSMQEQASKNIRIDGTDDVLTLSLPEDLLAVGTCWGEESLFMRMWPLVGFHALLELHPTHLWIVLTRFSELPINK